jgi:hypothetical protein
MEFITLETYKMGRDLIYPEEWKLVEANAAEFLSAHINPFFNYIGWARMLKQSSGWRPKGMNRAVDNAAKASYHIMGWAIDFEDDGFKDAFTPLTNEKDAAALRLFGLFMEHPAYTIKDGKSWVHLDRGNRSDRPTRTFRPY